MKGKPIPARTGGRQLVARDRVVVVVLEPSLLRIVLSSDAGQRFAPDRFGTGVTLLE